MVKGTRKPAWGPGKAHPHGREQSWHEQGRSLHRGLQEVQITLAARLGEAEEKIRVLHSGMYLARGPSPHTAPQPCQTRRRSGTGPLRSVTLRTQVQVFWNEEGKKGVWKGGGKARITQQRSELQSLEAVLLRGEGLR